MVKKRKLSSRDREQLRESGISDKTIRRNRLHTARNALVIPYRSLDGATNGFVRTRPHSPRVINGKSVKYEQPKGSKSRAYFPVASLKKLRDGKSSIFITEGEKKVWPFRKSDSQ